MENLLFNAHRKCGLKDNKYHYCGNICLIVRDKNSEKRITVFMKLFEECPKHYAVLYKDEECEFQYGHFNLLHCTINGIHDNKTQFQVSQINEGIGLLFEAPCASIAKDWMHAFQGKFLCPYFPQNRRVSRKGPNIVFRYEKSD